jgi:hypothetical protein
MVKASTRAWPRRPVALMSGRDVPPDVLLDVLSLGPTIFIRKPMRLADIESALAMFRSLLPGERRRPRGP